MKAVLLVRHGETVARRGAFCGHTDVRLSDLGKRQSRVIVDKLVDHGVQLIITTGLQRTDYCGRLAAAHGVYHIIEPELREVNFGLWEGMIWDEIERAYPQEARAWMEHPEAMRFPNGEDMADCRQRVQRAWDRVMALPWETVAIVGHSGTLGFLLRHISKGKEPSYLQHGEVIVLHFVA